VFTKGTSTHPPEQLDPTRNSFRRSASRVDERARSFLRRRALHRRSKSPPASHTHNDMDHDECKDTARHALANAKPTRERSISCWICCAEIVPELRTQPIAPHDAGVGVLRWEPPSMGFDGGVRPRVGACGQSGYTVRLLRRRSNAKADFPAECQDSSAWGFRL